MSTERVNVSTNMCFLRPGDTLYDVVVVISKIQNLQMTTKKNYRHQEYTVSRSDLETFSLFVIFFVSQIEY